MIELVIKDHLESLGYSVFMETPEGGLLPPCLLIERTGGGMVDHIRRGTVAIQSYGRSLYEAAELNARMIRDMDGILARPEVAACDLNSDYNYTDLEKKLYRYQAVFDLVYYEN